jgi:hypothetical protein
MPFIRDRQIHQGTEAPVHRSRLSVLTIFAAAAACSRRGDAGAAEALSKDPSLVATLEVRQKANQQPLPDACGAVAVVTGSGAANKPQAEELARKAYDAELVGNTQEAHSLLLRASALDGTDKSTAYHLGRTSEALGDRDGATTAYCRYLALAPTAAESVEARQRLARLSQLEPKMAGASVSIALTPQTVRVANTRRVARTHSTVASRAATRPRVEQPVRIAAAERPTRSASVVGDGVDDVPTQSGAAGTPPDVERRAERSGDASDGVATSAGVPSGQPSTAPGIPSRGPSRAQSAGIGAVAGAIIGAAAGRSVKSAVIGAAAGGVLGTVVGGGIRPAGRSMGSWAPRAPQQTGTRMARRPYYRLAPAA